MAQLQTGVGPHVEGLTDQRETLAGGRRKSRPGMHGTLELGHVSVVLKTFIYIRTVPHSGHNRKSSSGLSDGGAGWVK